MTTFYRPREIVLVHFPFSDVASTTRRPALVMLDTGDQDIVVARVTSQAARDGFDIAVHDLGPAGLVRASIVRVHKLATIEKRLVERRLGMLSDYDWLRVQQSAQRLWSAL